jgi:hypothetical protein
VAEVLAVEGDAGFAEISDAVAGALVGLPAEGAALGGEVVPALMAFSFSGWLRVMVATAASISSRMFS